MNMQGEASANAPGEESDNAQSEVSLNDQTREDAMRAAKLVQKIGEIEKKMDQHRTEKEFELASDEDRAEDAKAKTWRRLARKSVRRNQREKAMMHMMMEQMAKLCDSLS